MVLLILIELAQLVVNLLLLAVVLQQVTRQEIERVTAGDQVRGLQGQAVRAMFQAAQDDAPAGPVRTDRGFRS